MKFCHFLPYKWDPEWHGLVPTSPACLLEVYLSDTTRLFALGFYPLCSGQLGEERVSQLQTFLWPASRQVLWWSQWGAIVSSCARKSFLPVGNSSLHVNIPDYLTPCPWLLPLQGLSNWKMDGRATWDKLSNKIDDGSVRATGLCYIPIPSTLIWRE